MIVIDHHFHGPPDSGNGGYTCGRIDSLTDYITEVTLRRPIPLDVPLSVVREGDNLSVSHKDDLIATARPGTLDFEVPAPVSFAEAQEAAKSYLGITSTLAFPACYVCGANRPVGEGLHVYTGRVGESANFAAPWIPGPSEVEGGKVAPHFVWAALDCPGAYAAMGDTPIHLLLGRMTAEILEVPQVGDQCVLMAWVMEAEGRKYHCGTALYDSNQRLLAKAKAVWIAVKQP